MGKIWLETSHGLLVHFPIQEEFDANHCTNAVRVPTSIIGSQNRCYGEVIPIEDSPWFPGLVFNIDLRPPGITGLCNQCGMCCSHPPGECPDPENCGWPLNTDINMHCCPHLNIKNWRKWGQAGNTTCDLYATILDEHKECAFPPDVIYYWMTGCGYSFS